MITDKQEAIKEVNKSNVDFDQIDKRLLRDKEVVLAYIQYHSSNDLLYSKFPIDINTKGMIDDSSFILDVIKNLDVGYNRESLMSLIKYSANCILKRKIDEENLTEEDMSELKEFATKVVQQFYDSVNVRGKELEKKQSLLDEISNHINQTEADCCDGEKTKSYKKYKCCNIGFTAEF